MLVAWSSKYSQPTVLYVRTWVALGSVSGRRRGADPHGAQQKPPVAGRQVGQARCSLLQSMLPQLTNVSVLPPQCKQTPTTCARGVEGVDAWARQHGAVLAHARTHASTAGILEDRESLRIRQ